MSVKSKLMPLMQAVQKDKSLSSLPSLKEMSDLYKGEGQDDTSIHALQKLANGLRAKFSVTDKLSIDEMVDLLTKKSSIGNEPGTLLLHKDSVTSDQMLNLDRLLNHSYYVNSRELRVSFDYSSSSSNTCYITLWGATANPSSYEVAINPGTGHVTKVFNVSYVPSSGNQLNISCSGFTITNLNLREIIGGSTA